MPLRELDAVAPVARALAAALSVAFACCLAALAASRTLLHIAAAALRVATASAATLHGVAIVHSPNMSLATHRKLLREPETASQPQPPTRRRGAGAQK